VIFDEAIIPAEVILDIFFTLHDPTQLNRQGNDIGTSYRSCMFYDGADQKELFDQAIERAKQVWGEAIVTELLPLETFWMGETYHQDFFAKNPGQGYCNMVVKPKMTKTAKVFVSYLK
jgi:peptide-methionine (S)-S-oxide reductase